MKILPMLLADSYKMFHHLMYPKGITLLFSNMTPRSYKRIGCKKSVFFGLQYYIKEYMINQWNELFFNKPLEDVVKEYKRFHKHFSFVDVSTEHIEKLHNLGYLPLEIKALEEGSLVDEKVPYYTIHNTHPDFAWLVNFLETQMSTVIWDLTTNATISKMYRNILDKWAIKTTGSINGVEWQGHDFSMRGRSSIETCLNQAGHLLSFNGTDTIPAVLMLEKYYNANIEQELIGSSVPASEHSVMTSYGKEDELGAFKRLMQQFPAGILSIVSDSFDLWKVCTEFLPLLKEDILNRNGKLVIRPDSGNPVDIICGVGTKYQDISKYFPEGEILPEYFCRFLLDEVREETPHGEHGDVEYEQTYIVRGELIKAKIHNISWNRYDKQYYYIDMWDKANITIEKLEFKPSDKGVIELLWDVFGGSINEQGYKVLDSHIGAIYGDSITLDRAEEICKKLEEKGFASTNIVFGIGSYTFNCNTRDSLGIAVKSTYCEVDGECREIFKDPITDDGIKKSAKGLLAVIDGKLVDKTNWDVVNSDKNDLQTVFKDGVLIKDLSLNQIREKLNN